SPGQLMTTSTIIDALKSAANDSPNSDTSGLAAARRADRHSRRRYGIPRAAAASTYGAASASSTLARTGRTSGGAAVNDSARTGISEWRRRPRVAAPPAPAPPPAAPQPPA